MQTCATLAMQAQHWMSILSLHVLIPRLFSNLFWCQELTMGTAFGHCPKSAFRHIGPNMGQRMLYRLWFRLDWIGLKPPSQVWYWYEVDWSDVANIWIKAKSERLIVSGGSGELYKGHKILKSQAYPENAHRLIHGDLAILDTTYPLSQMMLIPRCPDMTWCFAGWVAPCEVPRGALVASMQLEDVESYRVIVYSELPP